MAININNSSQTNSLVTNLNKSTNQLNKASSHLSSGKRINSASDDPAGAAIAAQLLVNSDTDSVAARNVSDGISIANIADGALQSASDITGRLGELATQASNGTLSDSQRSSLNDEFQSLTQELDRLSNTTEFNGQQLLSGNGASVDLQVGTDADGNSQINLKTTGVSAQSLGLAGLDISSQAGAAAAINVTKTANDTVTQTRGDIGSTVSRLDTAYSNLKTSEVNQREAEDRITSADIAEEVANRTRNSILQQANAGLLAQANSSAANVLKLIS